MHRSAVPLTLLLLLACGDTDSATTTPVGTDSGSTPATGEPSGTTGLPSTGTPTGVTTGTPSGTTSTPGVTFTAHRIASPAGPAFVTVVDVDADGALDIVLSRFGTIGLNVPAGAVELYSRSGAGMDQWSMTEIVSQADQIEFPNHTTAADIDGDGDLDIVVPSGFLVCAAIPWAGPCGGLSWFEQHPTGWVRHTLFDGNSSFAHHVALEDIDGDGRTDLLTVMEEINAFGPDSAIPVWFAGTDDALRFDPQPMDMGIAAGLGSFPTMLDLDGDGDLDVASAEYAVAGGSLAWLERTADPSPTSPGGLWQRHVIADDIGPSIQLGFVEDLYGDGALMAVASNHTNTAQNQPDPWESAIYVLEIPSDPTQSWPKHQASTGIVSVPGSAAAPQAAPGIFGHGDIDGDGDIDLAVSGDGDPRVFWLEQVAPQQWVTHVLHHDLPQAGGMVVADLDGDGTNELVITGYEDNALFVLERDLP